MIKIDKYHNFVNRDIWRLKAKHLPKKHSLFLRFLRVALLVKRGFAEDKCQLHASALTFYSLLSIVPVLAMAFGVAKGFGFEGILKDQLLGKIHGQEQALTHIINFSYTLLENTKGSLIAGFGVALLFWAVISALTDIERAFDDIWGVKKLRSISRRFSDYLAIIVICPVLMIIASSATIFVASQVTVFAHKFKLLGLLGPGFLFLVKLLPYCAIWALFVFIYMFVPNTKVNFRSALFAGIAAGTIYQIVQWVFLVFQIKVTRFNAIYGSFAAIPLFLSWLQLSWIIVLLGGEISFAHQNVDTYEFEPDCARVSHSFKKLVSLNIMHLLVKNFQAANRPLASDEISSALDVPIRLVRQILFELVECGMVAELATEEYREKAYQPARNIDVFTVQYVLDTLDNRGVDDIPIAQTKELGAINSSLEVLRQVVERSPGNRLLKDI